METSHTKMCGCNEPLAGASISPRKTNIGPKMPGAVDEAAIPSVHHSRGGAALARLLFFLPLWSSKSTVTWRDRIAALAKKLLGLALFDPRAIGEIGRPELVAWLRAAHLAVYD